MRRKPEKPDVLEFYLGCVLRTYRDAAATCGLASSSCVAKDCEVLKTRTRSEGMSFLTKTLPSLGKCLDKALSSDVPFPAPSSFTISKRAPYPLFLGGFWELIFDTEGRIRHFEPQTLASEREPTEVWNVGPQRDVSFATKAERQILAVRAVRQICFLLYKLEGAHSKESEAQVMSDFIACDESLPSRDADLSISATTRRALENASLLVHRVLCGLDLHNITPGHGPGAVATGEKPWEKMNFSRYYESLDEVYPYSDYFFYNYSHLVDDLQSLDALTTQQHKVAKVVLVPKDSRGPRLISMEPLELQWIQQGQMRALINHIEHAGTLASGYVNFTNQEINRGLALLHSEDGELATVDMKDASDRVSCWLVDHLFPPQIKLCLYASRSDYTRLPTGATVRLNKFAPMGSSVCFPIEALAFWALAVGSLRDIRSNADFKRLPEVYVFGDDIILRKEDYAVIRPVFEELSLRFNLDKCCLGRFFRESCGMDAFKGVPVSPLRIKARIDDLSPSATLSYVSYINTAMEKGLVELANYLKQNVERLSGSVPIVNKSGLTPYALVDRTWSNEEVERRLRDTFKTRYNRALQRDEVRIPMPLPPSLKKGEPDWSELLRLKRMGSFHDPFGFRRGAAAPCRHTVPNELVVRRVWVAMYSLLS